jgi:hypothetical protein
MKPTVRETEKVGEKNSSGATERHKSVSSEGEGKELMNCAKRQEGRTIELQRTLLPLSSTPFALILKQTVMIQQTYRNCYTQSLRRVKNLWLAASVASIMLAVHSALTTHLRSWTVRVTPLFG